MILIRIANTPMIYMIRGLVIPMDGHDVNKACFAIFPRLQMHVRINSPFSFRDHDENRSKIKLNRPKYRT